MASTLHRAIHDALSESPGYAEKGILPVLALEATRALDADDSLLYRSVYTIFRAMPDRLVPGTTLSIATFDTLGGVQLLWEGKERMQEGDAARDQPLRAVFGHGPHGDLVEIAILALVDFCKVRAGHVATYRDRVAATAFDRPPCIIRRVEALIPVRPAEPANA